MSVMLPSASHIDRTIVSGPTRPALEVIVMSDRTNHSIPAAAIDARQRHSSTPATLSPRPRRRQAGAAAVEFAIITPIMLAMCFGIIEWGLVLYNKAVLTNAAREGARTGILLRTQAQRTAGADVTAANARALAYCNGMLITMAGSNTCTVAAAPTGAKASGVDTLTVTTTHTYSGTGLLTLYAIMAGPITLTQRSVMTYE